MLNVKKEGIILKPTKNSFENLSVLNPAAFKDGQKVHLIYRAINKKMVSSLGYACLNGPLEIEERWTKPFMAPEHSYERMGLEDPRLVKIKDTFYLTYVVYSGQNALSAYAEGADLFKLKKRGIISPPFSYGEASEYFKCSNLKDDYYFFQAFYQKYFGRSIKLWHKDTFFFPEKINGQFALVTRILPDMQIIRSENLEQLKDENFWKDYLMNLASRVIMEGEHGFEAHHVGGGAPPIKTKHGWLLIYHGAEATNQRRIYRAGAALLDLKNPKKLIARLPYPLICPDQKYEISGLANNVVFPTGTAIFNGRLYIYYGCGDSRVAAASLKLDELLTELMKFKKFSKTSVKYDFTDYRY